MYIEENSSFAARKFVFRPKLWKEIGVKFLESMLATILISNLLISIMYPTGQNYGCMLEINVKFQN